MQDRHFIALGAGNMLIAIGAGAFGAHGLKNILSPDMLAVWQTAVQYQLIHGLAMLLIVALGAHLSRPHLHRIGWLFFAGVVIFSGSLYALALTGIKILGAITPIGGLAFLFAWAGLVWASLNMKDA
ncbi:MAG: DUF423 domain-containing protein [Burkholderiaceae bacterium]|nr:DUF423 domain-containing protein [Burkholderiaceae bacterium]